MPNETKKKFEKFMLDDKTFAVYENDEMHIFQNFSNEAVVISRESYNKLVDFAASHWNMTKNGKVEI